MDKIEKKLENVYVWKLQDIYYEHTFTRRSVYDTNIDLKIWKSLKKNISQIILHYIRKICTRN